MSPDLDGQGADLSPAQVMSGGAGPDRPPPAAVLVALKELVRLKDLKDRFGETADYRDNKDRAWAEARRLVGSA